jgi:hypothetical protein
MKTKLLLLVATCYLPIAAFGQGSCYPAGVVLLDTGRPANGASVRVCTSGSTGTPCTPAASLFTDPTLGTPLGGSPTVTTDAHGNFGFCAAAGANYDLQISGTGITPLTIKNLPLPPTSPIVAGSLTSSSANPANVGLIKLATGDCLDWRNNALSGNIQLCKNTSDQLDVSAFPGIVGATLVAPVLGNASATSLVATAVGGGSGAPIRVQAAANAFMSYENTSAAADQKWWDTGVSGNVFVGRAVNDANSASANWVSVTRGAGATIGAITFGAGGGVQAVPSSTGNFVLDTAAQTLTNKTLTSPAISTPTFTGLCNNNNAGCKSQRFGSSCTTAAAVNSPCNTTYTWTSPFVDGSYTISCSPLGAASGIPIIEQITSVVGASFVLTIIANSAAAAQLSGVQCVAVHD